VTELFGVPVGAAAAALLVALAVALGAVGALALRNRVFLRLALRNARRRPARSSLVVIGLMLGTTIIAAALATGDTMSHTIRSSAIAELGRTDIRVAPRSADVDLGTELGAASGAGSIDVRVAGRIDAALAGTGLVDGVTPAILEPVALQAPASRRNEPRATLFAADPARMGGFGEIRAGGAAVALDALRPGEAYVNEDAAEELGAGAGARITAFAAGRPVPLRVRAVVRFDGAGTDGSAVLMPLGAAQRILRLTGRAEQILISNRGGPTSGAGLSPAVLDRLEPLLTPLGLEAQPVKQDAIDAADLAGATFMSVFTTFGSFSIAAGALLIFLIFVMLAAERRGELGIARAVGTRRGHLVQMFVFEGLAYDLVAALVGALAGAAVAYGMVAVLAGALGDEGLDVEFAVSPRSLWIAFALGVLLTLAVVAASAWRVSRMTISAAIRSLPEPPPRRRRRGLAAGAGLALGLLLVLGGWSSANATPLLLGLSLIIVALVPAALMLGVPERAAFTAAGLVTVIMWMLPWRTWEAIFGELRMDFGTWIVSGLMVVIGAVWTIVYNADALLGLARRVVSRLGSVAPVTRLAMAHPLRTRFRTGTTLAMFTLVVFTLVTGTVSSGSFMAAFGRSDAFGGGFDVRAGTPAASAVTDIRAALRIADEPLRSDFTVVGSQSYLPVEAAQVGAGRGPEPYPARGLDAGFLRHTTFGLGAIARGYGSAEDVWAAMADRPGLAVVDSTIVPRRDRFGFVALASDFRISGFSFEDGAFDPVPVEVRDPQTGRRARLTVIGVLKDTAPLEMAGISTSQATLARAFPGRVRPTVHYLSVAPGVDPEAAAARLEAAFLPEGMEAESIEAVLEDITAASRTFNRLIQGFMGLGLVVGVAALGVISARAVVERRQQIGVLRAIGFRRWMVQATFLAESTMIAGTAIVVGTGLGLLLGFNIVDDQRRQASWDGLTLVVPWANLAVIFAVVYGVAMLATLAPARRAARVLPAEALRYQ
jgi:putative ABC transport system permease protein